MDNTSKAFRFVEIYPASKHGFYRECVAVIEGTVLRAEHSAILDVLKGALKELRIPYLEMNQSHAIVLEEDAANRVLNELNVPDSPLRVEMRENQKRRQTAETSTTSSARWIRTPDGIVDRATGNLLSVDAMVGEVNFWNTKCGAQWREMQKEIEVLREENAALKSERDSALSRAHDHTEKNASSAT